MTQKGKDGEDITISYAYDNLGNITSVTDGEGNTFRMTYDKVGNVTAIYDAYGQLAESYTYDSVYNQTSVTDGNGAKMLYSYDRMGNKIKALNESNTITRTYDALNRVTSYTDAEGNTIKYSYDEFGNIETVTYPDGQDVSYTYDANGNILTMMDWKGRVTSYDYDKNGRLVKTQRSDGSVETRTYDKAGNLISIKDVKKDGNVINDYTYNYDQSGNITTITDKSVAKNSPQTATDSTVQMEYDSVNRLIKYNGKEVRYDADGNMIYGPLNGEMATFKYDCRNRLLEAVTDSGETTQYVYDAENVRTKVIKNAGIQKETVTTYVTDSVSHELSRVLEATTTDKAGNTQNILYTYGNGQYGVASDANGLYYMRARYYNIDIMRFINQDILTGSIDSSQSLNRYAYVEGNPVNYLDPFGLDTSCLHKAITLLTIVAVGVTAVVIASSYGSATVAALSTFSTVSNILTAIDSLVYLYDYFHARNEQEKNDALLGMTINLTGIFLGEIVDMLTNISKVFVGEELKVVNAVIAYDYSAAGAASSNIIAEVGD